MWSDPCFVIMMVFGGSFAGTVLAFGLVALWMVAKVRDAVLKERG